MDDLPPELIPTIERGFRDIAETNREILRLIGIIEERRQQRKAKFDRNASSSVGNGKASSEKFRETEKKDENSASFPPFPSFPKTEEQTIKLPGIKDISPKTSEFTECISPKSSNVQRVKTGHDKRMFAKDCDISNVGEKTTELKGNVLDVPSKPIKGLYTGESIKGVYASGSIEGLHTSESIKGAYSSESIKEVYLKESSDGIYSGESTEELYSSESIKGLSSSETKKEVYYRESVQGLYSIKTRRSQDNRIPLAKQQKESISTDTYKTSDNVSSVDINQTQVNTQDEDDGVSEIDKEAIESFFAFNAVCENPRTEEERVTVHIRHWDKCAKAEIGKWRIPSEAQGVGRDIIFCLDISSSMKGNPLKRARTFVREKIKELQHADQTISVYDHVALVTFGGETKVQQHLTYEYYELLTKLDRVRPGGPSPLYAGLKMCEAVIQSSDRENKSSLRRTGTLTTTLAKTGDSMLHVIGDKTITASSTDTRDIVYVISDGKATPSSFLKGPDVCTEEEEREEQDRVVSYCKDLQKKYHFAIVGVHVGDTMPNSWAVYDDVLVSTDLVLNVKDEQKSISEEPDTDRRYPDLGTRVRRKGQRLCGTVTKHYHDGIGITWDEVIADIGTEKEDVEEALLDSIKVVDQPRELNGKLIAVGCRVVRGRDQDGSFQHKGTVLKVKDSGIVKVVWDDGDIEEHRFGLDGLFEIELDQPADKETLSTTHANGAEALGHSQYPSADEPFKWRWKDAGGVWHTYPDEINKAIEVSYCTNERGAITINIEDRRYNIIFSRMIQVDVDTKEKYPVARR